MRLRTFTYTKQRIRTPGVRNFPMKRTSRTCMRLQQAHVAHKCVLYTYRYGPYPVRNVRFLVFIRTRPEGYPSDTSVCITVEVCRGTGHLFCRTRLTDVHDPTASSVNLHMCVRDFVSFIACLGPSCCSVTVPCGRVRGPFCSFCVSPAREPGNPP